MILIKFYDAPAFGMTKRSAFSAIPDFVIKIGEELQYGAGAKPDGHPGEQG